MRSTDRCIYVDTGNLMAVRIKNLQTIELDLIRGILEGSQNFAERMLRNLNDRSLKCEIMK